MDIITYAMLKGLMNKTISEEIAKALSELPKGSIYRGAVDYQSDLPNDAEIGDTYTVKYQGTSGAVPDGTEYIWGPYEGTNVWISLGPDPSQFLQDPGQGTEGQVLTKTSTAYEWADASGSGDVQWGDYSSEVSQEPTVAVVNGLLVGRDYVTTYKDYVGIVGSAIVGEAVVDEDE